MQYLKQEQLYIDRYDLHTIEECLKWYWDIKGGFEKHRNDKDFEKYTKKKFDTEVHKVTSYTVNVIKIQRYRHKAETLKEWMDRDRQMQDKFDNAIPPDDIYCKECTLPTKVTSKDLMNSYEENAQVLFMFECVKCKKKQALYEDGTEWHYEEPKCPECKSPMTSKSKDTKEVLTTYYSCSNCSYKKKDIYDFKKSRKEREAREARDEKLLTEYRKGFCLDEVEGPRAVLNLDNIVRFVDEMKEKEKKEKNPIFQKSKQLKKLKVVQLKELLEKSIEKDGYKDLQFGKPEMGQFVIIDFTVNDTKDERQEYDSENTLKKLIKSRLEDTTWRLMSEGIHYRLGILSGRLKAYEREEDLMKLISG